MVSCIGSDLGKAALAGRDCVTNQQINSIIVDPGVDPYFVYYNLSCRRSEIRQQAGGSAQPILNKTDFGRLPILLPPLAEQRAISGILGVLDDKIESNRRMSETLESIARELYRAWFVDFSAGPASNPKFAGEFPAGWSYGTLANLSDLSSESWRAASAPDAVVYLDLSNVKWGRVLGTVSYSWGEAPSRARRILRSGDTIVGTVRPGNGSYSLITQDGLTGSTGFAVLRPKTHTARAITYLAATDPSNMERLAHLADGAAYPAVRPAAVHESPLLVPDQDTLLEFSSAVDPLLDRIATCEAENQTLGALRDTLLPKLISGELRVPGAEQLVSEVA